MDICSFIGFDLILIRHYDADWWFRNCNHSGSANRCKLIILVTAAFAKLIVIWPWGKGWCG